LTIEYRAEKKVKKNGYKQVAKTNNDFKTHRLMALLKHQDVATT
jgi:hypothetical protein